MSRSFSLYYPFELNDALPSPPITNQIDNPYDFLKIDSLRYLFDWENIELIHDVAKFEISQHNSAKMSYEIEFEKWRSQTINTLVFRNPAELTRQLNNYRDEEGNLKRLVNVQSSCAKFIGPVYCTKVADPAEDLDLYWSYYYYVRASKNLHRRIEGVVGN